MEGQVDCGDESTPVQPSRVSTHTRQSVGSRGSKTKVTLETIRVTVAVVDSLLRL